MEKCGGSGGDAKGAPASDEEDAHTVFIRSLPYSLTDAQLEEVFSEIGPVRHCFTVKEKGSDQHRGFGYVHFAVTEDARRAVREKNGALLQGRKIKVQVAKRRAPLAVRLPKTAVPETEPTVPEEERCSTPSGPEADSKKRKPNFVAQKEIGEKVNEDLRSKRAKQSPGGKSEPANKTDRKKEYDASQGSSKQRPARTVVVGGLESSEMLDAVIVEAKKSGSIEIVQRTLTEVELQSNALARDGCKPRAAAIVFLSVKAARQAVAILHNKMISGIAVWARQLGGEGSKLKKLRLIVRNLPFQVTEAMLRELLSPAGFLWEVTIPRQRDGRSRGFAFVGFTSKTDAEKAIKLANGKHVAKRPITVDWAVGKKQYETAATPETPASDVNVGGHESKRNAAGPGSHHDGVFDDNADSGTADDSSDESGHAGQSRASAGKDLPLSSRKGKHTKPGGQKSISENVEESSDEQLSGSDHNAEDGDERAGIGRAEEIDMVQKILTKVVTSFPDNADENKENVQDNPCKHPAIYNSKSLVATDLQRKKVAPADLPVESKEQKADATDTGSKDDKLSRTVFIRNLPAEAKVPELRKLFAEFGKIKSFRLVLHPITKKSKGNAFLEYAEREAAEAAVVGATTSTADDVGLMLKGRVVSVSMAVDKNSARKMAKETFQKQVDGDKRNLALAKEGQILPNTAAAEGVSKKDMMKRQQLEHEKATKLRSSNFHVSKTRLLVHNVPKTVTGTQLKQLFLEGVKSRASKQRPIIKQVKILHDENTQRSRGVAFIEFKEHQHALVALRVLNNNPVTFGAENRPIVEFAIENSLVLRKRAAIAERARKLPSKGGQGEGAPRVVDDERERGGKYKQTKHEKANKDIPQNVSARANGQSPFVKESKKGKLRNRKNKSRKSSENGLQEVSLGEESLVEIRNDSGAQMKPGSKKRQKIGSADKKVKRAKREFGETKFEVSADAGDNGSSKGNSRKLGKRAKQAAAKPSPKAPLAERSTLPRQPDISKESKSNTSQPIEQQGGPNGKCHPEMEKRRSRKRKGGEGEDNLDKLVAEYRKKYFSSDSARIASKGTGASEEHRKWFE